MPEDKFEDIIIKPGEPLIIKGKTFKDTIELKNNIIATGVIIENCIFEQEVIFEGIDLNCGIKFENCVFKKSFLINECHAENINYEIGFYDFHLQFSNTRIETLSFTNNNQLVRGIKIKDNSIIDSLKINNLFCTLSGISIQNSTINNSFEIRDSVVRNNITIEDNSIINCQLIFDNNITDSCIFSDSTFNKHAGIFGGEVNSINFRHGIFNDDFKIVGLPLLKNLTVFRTEFKRSITYILWNKPNQIQINQIKINILSGKFEEGFIIEGNHLEIDTLTINTSKQLEGALYFNDVNIVSATITGDNYNSNIIFNNSNFNSLTFYSFNNYSNLSIISAKSFERNSSLRIDQTNLGKAQLFDVDLNSFKEVSINNSILTEINTANIKWFDDKKLNTEEPVSKDTYNQKKEIYRQIKHALEKQGDRTSSLHFKALEMKSYKKEKFTNVVWYKKIFNNDRFVLLAGQTNNFGLNWFKPVLFAIGLSIFFYFLIIVGISDQLSCTLNFSNQSLETTWKVFTDNLNLLPQLMDPTHQLSRIFPDHKNLTFAVYLIDYIHKIFLAFFIFQTISAFRKYIK